ncbi:hypothetical protein MSMEI_6258 [Mycolicibacterium smegmatis MC2 155]|uniref:Uncharacterized protein n=1 Tax=Mycolicibacterium smegmatis (strain ATCC 700084 / mc(2)155) TaxID=246196 RepID=I7GGF3_MYCS2|nr:hypothetical protein MSMEI_6258 [Mycolicibacterium smegmatis MC2 155]
MLGTRDVTALPLVVLAHVEQYHRLIERRGNGGDVRLCDFHIVHTVHARTRSCPVHPSVAPRRVAARAESGVSNSRLSTVSTGSSTGNAGRDGP